MRRASTQPSLSKELHCIDYLLHLVEIYLRGISRGQEGARETLRCGANSRILRKVVPQALTTGHLAKPQQKTCPHFRLKRRLKLSLASCTDIV